MKRAQCDPYASNYIRLHASPVRLINEADLIEVSLVPKNGASLR